ncbi:MAG: glycosyltransferase family 2 protein [Candidatus Homeothermus sp.]|nr:glycosyltransferase family 2 protein [Candidatus Homeothermus sp.]
MENSILQVLISCMHQDAGELLSRTRVSGSGIVINQCDDNNNYNLGNTLIINTTERGLSKSRNMALRNATGDICLICDDDEILDNDYSEKIEQAYKENPSADVIAFQIQDAGKKYPNKKKRIRYIGALKLASWQLTFRRKSIIDNNIRFDETLGSGVSKAGGEENMFVYDCLKKGLKVIFVPVTIGRMIEGDSQWFHGYTPEYFYDRGIMTRKLMGSFWASLYAIYFLSFKYKSYHNDVGLMSATNRIFYGIFKN